MRGPFSLDMKITRFVILSEAKDLLFQTFGG